MKERRTRRLMVVWGRGLGPTEPGVFSSNCSAQRGGTQKKVPQLLQQFADILHAQTSIIIYSFE